MPVASPIAQRLWTRAEYHAADKAGAFGPEERLELIEGRIIPKVSPQSAPHAMAIAVTSELLEDALGRGYHIREEKPIVLNDRSEPEPDIVVLKGRGRDYHDHPTSDQVLLVIEVSDSRLQYDMIDKAASYAAAGIREYWVINLVRRVIEVYRDPIQASESASGYEYSLRYVKSPGEKLSMLEFPNISLAVDDMLPSNLSRPTVSI